MTLFMHICNRKEKWERTMNAATGAKPAFVITPGICGSSMGSASGGTAAPPALRVRAHA